MKVAHYSTLLSRSAGGLFYSVSGLAKAQVDSGSDVLVVGGVDEYFEQDKIQWDGVPLLAHELVVGGYGLSPRAVKELRRFKPDLIHVHGIWSAASLYARVFSAAGIPMVISPRGMLDPWILARRRNVKRVHAALLERPALRKAHIHALNQSELESVIKYIPRAADRTFVIPNGVGAAIEHEKTERSGVLYIGRLHAKKQIIQLIELWRRSSNLKNTLLTVAGWGEDDYERQVRQAVHGASNVRFVGALYGDAKERALCTARFFILPSLSEGLPMAVLEALQHGAIPLITEQCNLPELIDEGIALRIATDLSDTEAKALAADALPIPELELQSKRAKQFSRRYLWSSISEQMQARYTFIVEQRQP